MPRLCILFLAGTRSLTKSADSETVSIASLPTIILSAALKFSLNVIFPVTAKFPTMNVFVGILTVPDPLGSNTISAFNSLVIILSSNIRSVVIMRS